MLRKVSDFEVVMFRFLTGFNFMPATDYNTRSQSRRLCESSTPKLFMRKPLLEPLRILVFENHRDEKNSNLSGFSKRSVFR